MIVETWTPNFSSMDRVKDLWLFLLRFLEEADYNPSWL